MEIKDLPIQPSEFEYKVSEDKKAQFAVITKLVDGCKEIIHAGDTDEEGQLIVDEIVRFLKTNKPVKRVLINDNNLEKVVNDLQNLTDNSLHEKMGWRAYARSILDWLVGINISRLMTVAYRHKIPNSKVLSVGRVQSTILAIVVERDRQHEAHESQLYYKVYGKFNFPTTQGLISLEKPVIEDVERHRLDSAGRMMHLSDAQKIAEGLTGEEAVITVVDIGEKKTAPPLPFNLAKFQHTALKKFKIPLDLLEKTLQDLKDKHKLITYPRTSCQYLTDEAFNEAPNVLNALKRGLPEDLQHLVAGADTSIKSRAFNTSKVAEHHGMCPTAKEPNLSELSKVEKDLYLLIVQYYAAQFFPPERAKVTKIEFTCNGEKFKASSKIILDAGWRVVFQGEALEEDEKEDDGETNVDLSVLKVDDKGTCVSAEDRELKTRPPRRYDVADLIKEISSNVSRFIKSENLSEYYRKKEKEMRAAGLEPGGIGTEATLPSIMRTLYDRKFLEKSGDNEQLKSTDIGRGLYDRLDDCLKRADMTAYWQILQMDINTKEDALQCAEQVLRDAIVPVIEQVKIDIGYDPSSEEYKPKGNADYDGPVQHCPICQRELRRRAKKSGDGYFWYCTGWNEKPPCSFSCGDKAGLPDFPAIHKDNCSKCGSVMTVKSGTSSSGNTWTKAECTNGNCKHVDWL